MDRLKAMQVFVAVAEQGSLTAAADRLDMSRAMVTRYLAELEDWVGVRLLHRSTRKVTLTNYGGEMLPKCRQMLSIGEELSALGQVPDDAPRGVLRLTASMSLGQSWLAPKIAEYLARYPGVAVDMVLVDRAVNLVEERIDLAIRITNDLDPNLIARQLGTCRSVICASPEYLARHGIPRTAHELALHNCLTYSYFGKSLWRFDTADGPRSVPVSGTLTANESSVLLAATLAGVGISQQPRYATKTLLEEGRIVELLPGHEPATLGVYGVYGSRRHVSAPLRTFLDFLLEAFAADPLWQ